MRTEGRSVFAAWHGTPVEDELDADQVEIWTDVRDELRRWRGGIGIMAADGTVVVMRPPARARLGRVVAILALVELVEDQ